MKEYLFVFEDKNKFALIFQKDYLLNKVHLKLRLALCLKNHIINEGKATMVSPSSNLLDQETCTITFYRRDAIEDVSRVAQKKAMTFTKETSGKIHEIVCDYFKVPQEDEWGQRVLQSLFHLKAFDRAELIKRDHPNVIIGLKASGNLHLFCSFPENKSQVALNKQGMIKVSVSHIASRSEFKLDSEIINDRHKSDHLAIAFFNNETFVNVWQANAKNGMNRKFEKIAPPSKTTQRSSFISCSII